jgi:protein-S-isoprenylcysteine O-methyltransferase Ste14
MNELPMTPLRRILRQWESPPTWLILCAALAWGQSRYLPIWDAGRLGDWLGAAFIVTGVGLMLVSLAQFARARTTVMPREEARVLMTGGVFQLSRNPVYVADALILTGLCLRWDLGALIWAVVFVIIIDQRFVEGEEAGLRAKFGAEFHDWAEKTRRWI